MNKPVVWVAGVLLLLFAFSLLIYPTAYRYDQYSITQSNGQSFSVPIRTNIFNGKTQEYESGVGWVENEDVSN